MTPQHAETVASSSSKSCEIDPGLKKERDRAVVRSALRRGESAYKALVAIRQREAEGPPDIDPEVLALSSKCKRILMNPDPKLIEESRLRIRNGLPGILDQKPGLKNSHLTTVPEATPEQSPSDKPGGKICRFCGKATRGGFLQCYDCHLKNADST